MLCTSLYISVIINSGSSSTIILTKKDIVNLLHLLQYYSFKWKEIGLSLGFITPELNVISSMPLLRMDAPTSYLQELLSQWVQWPTASHPTRPTLESFCAALQSPLVHLSSLSDRVNKEMRQGMSVALCEEKKISNCYIPNMVYGTPFLLHIIESVDSINRDGPDIPIYIIH